jgi:hypothetical protein
MPEQPPWPPLSEPPAKEHSANAIDSRQLEQIRKEERGRIADAVCLRLIPLTQFGSASISTKILDSIDALNDLPDVPTDVIESLSEVRNIINRIMAHELRVALGVSPARWSDAESVYWSTQPDHDLTES